MIDRERLLAELDSELGQDRQFRRHWRRRVLRWNDAVAADDRNAGIFRRRVFDRTCDAVDSGMTDPDDIHGQVCGSFVGQLIIGIAANMIIKIMINRILKRLGLLPQDCEVAE